MNEPLKKILVVDDEYINYILVREILNQFNIESDYAQNGFDTIKMCVKNNNYSLILLDIKMKGINGFETASKLNDLNIKIPVIFYTAFANDFQKDPMMQSMGYKYLEKPLKINKFLEMVQPYIERIHYENNLNKENSNFEKTQKTFFKKIHQFLTAIAGIRLT